MDELAATPRTWRPSDSRLVPRRGLPARALHNEERSSRLARKRGPRRTRRPGRPHGGGRPARPPDGRSRRRPATATRRGPGDADPRRARRPRPEDYATYAAEVRQDVRLRAGEAFRTGRADVLRQLLALPRLSAPARGTSAGATRRLQTSRGAALLTT
ncbi:hypothetical protein [Streptomyces thioluteus]|uniref:hypothetical protein n=1 Tax=Streptomyces thioluteus TaxID=66431 RepID=UPI0031E95712